jgi:hypothetical protein
MAAATRQEIGAPNTPLWPEESFEALVNLIELLF